MSQPINIDLSQQKDFRCDCGCAKFQQRFIVKMIPGVLIGATGTFYQSIGVLECVNCLQNVFVVTTQGLIFMKDFEKKMELVAEG